MKRLAILLAPLCITCASPHTAPSTVYRDFAQQVTVVDDSIVAMEITPLPPVYLHWMSEVVRCAGVKPEALPSFWVAQLPTFPARHGALAFYVQESQRVILGLGYENVPFTVRHEFLHHLLAPFIPAATGPETFEMAQKRMHPAEYFGSKDVHGMCQDLVWPPRVSPEAPQSVTSPSDHGS